MGKNKSASSSQPVETTAPAPVVEKTAPAPASSATRLEKSPRSSKLDDLEKRLTRLEKENKRLKRENRKATASSDEGAAPKKKLDNAYFCFSRVIKDELDKDFPNIKTKPEKTEYQSAFWHFAKDKLNEKEFAKTNKNENGEYQYDKDKVMKEYKRLLKSARDDVEKRVADLRASRPVKTK